MAIYTGTLLGDQLCKALGINPQSIQSIALVCKVGDAARVVTKGFAETNDGKVNHLCKEIKRYKLVEG